MRKLVLPVLAAAAVLGVVGGFAASQAFKPVEHQPAPKVQFVRPAAETAAPTVTVTATATPPKPKPAPVESTTSASAPKKIQQKVATVSEPAPETTTNPPAPVETGSEAAARGNLFKPPPGTLAPNSTNP